MLLKWLQVIFLFSDLMENGSSVGGSEVYSFQTPKRSNKMAELGMFSSFLLVLAGGLFEYPSEHDPTLLFTKKIYLYYYCGFYLTLNQSSSETKV